MKELLILALLLTTPLLARTGAEEEEALATPPWLTGSLLTPSAYAVEKGHYNIEPYLYVTTRKGVYDASWKSHSTRQAAQITPQVYLEFGIWDHISFKAIPTASYTILSGQKSLQVNDLPIGFHFQLLLEQPGKWYPTIKFGLSENLPLGKYQRLDPHKKGTDSGGAGSFATTPELVFGRLFHFGNGVHYLNTRLSFSYTIPAPVHVKGWNTYGGGCGTRGKVYPGNLFSTFLGLEWTVTQHWALACDIVNLYQNKTRFSGHKGESAPGIPNSVGGPSSNQISIAPAIEYNWSAGLGIIGGVWWTIAGRNTPEFVSGVIALNYYH